MCSRISNGKPENCTELVSFAIDFDKSKAKEQLGIWSEVVRMIAMFREKGVGEETLALVM